MADREELLRLAEQIESMMVVHASLYVARGGGTMHIQSAANCALAAASLRARAQDGNHVPEKEI